MQHYQLLLLTVEDPFIINKASLDFLKVSEIQDMPVEVCSIITTSSKEDIII